MIHLVIFTAGPTVNALRAIKAVDGYCEVSDDETAWLVVVEDLTAIELRDRLRPLVGDGGVLVIQAKRGWGTHGASDVAEWLKAHRDFF